METSVDKIRRSYLEDGEGAPTIEKNSTIIQFYIYVP